MLPSTAIFQGFVISKLEVSIEMTKPDIHVSQPACACASLASIVQ